MRGSWQVIEATGHDDAGDLHFSLCFSAPSLDVNAGQGTKLMLFFVEQELRGGSTHSVCLWPVSVRMLA